MLLAIDIGNSHTVIGLFRDDQFIGQWRFKSDRERTVDELAIHCHGLFSMIGIAAGEIRGIIIASVVPSLEASWSSYCRKYLSANLEYPPLLVSAENIKKSIQIKTDNPDEVGADRLVNAIAGWQKYRCNLLIIDFGTAITFDCVSAECEYLGGAILPGVAIALDALSSRTAKLPRIDISVGPEKVIGTNTVQAMKSGILHGYGALVDGMTQKIRHEIGCADGVLKVIATGGMAHLIAPYAQSIEEVEPMLTLNGLHFLHSQQ
ncbi:MAG: type III pantothenate kinase [Proteobacteria bacterium]|nr:type III pantothenate kinase [Pseudomonadota bacterium]MBU1649400.1 type III pantothenate kinase [Pseudomonadota bacterium]